jgi:hypothetical protein
LKWPIRPEISSQQSTLSPKMKSGSSEPSAAASRAVPTDPNAAAPLAAEGFGVMVGAPAAVVTTRAFPLTV